MLGSLGLPSHLSLASSVLSDTSQQVQEWERFVCWTCPQATKETRRVRGTPEGEFGRWRGSVTVHVALGAHTHPPAEHWAPHASGREWGWQARTGAWLEGSGLFPRAPPCYCRDQMDRLTSETLPRAAGTMGKDLVAPQCCSLTL